MKYCTHCGAQVTDQAEICLNCGCLVAPNANQPTPQTQPTEKNKQLATASKILLIAFDVLYGVAGVIIYPIIIGALFFLTADALELEDFIVLAISLGVQSGFLLISLTWCIPLTVVTCRKLKNGETLSVPWKIAILLTTNTIAGICLLCMKEEPKPSVQQQNYYPPQY